VTPLSWEIFAGVVGACVGSFLNVVIWRLPRGQSLVRPRSRCPGCGHEIRWFDNVPILSWLLLRARCRACRRRISARYPLVEALTAALFVVASRRVGWPPDAGLFAVDAIFVAAMVAVAFIDFDTRLIPDAISKPGLVVGLLASLLVPAMHGVGFLPEMRNRHVASLLEGAAGAATGAGVLLAIRWVGSIVLKKEAMGLGDVKLLATIGAFTSPLGTLLTLLLASLAGAFLGVGFVAVRRRTFAPLSGSFAGASVVAGRANAERVALVVRGEPPKASDVVPLALVIPADPAWFDADVRLSLRARVERVEPRSESEHVVHATLESPNASATETLDTFAHARLAVPFGPFLAAAGVAMRLYETPIRVFVTETWPSLVAPR
jgi:leader peptidase (prepilin peptidase)/N-methyltransferase